MISYPGPRCHYAVVFEVHIVVCVRGSPLCFKYSRDDRHSIYLDVRRFELLGVAKPRLGLAREIDLFEQAHREKILK